MNGLEYYEAAYHDQMIIQVENALKYRFPEVIDFKVEITGNTAKIEFTSEIYSKEKVEDYANEILNPTPHKRTVHIDYVTPSITVGQGKVFGLFMPDRDDFIANRYLNKMKHYGVKATWTMEKYSGGVVYRFTIVNEPLKNKRTDYMF